MAVFPASSSASAAALSRSHAAGRAFAPGRARSISTWRSRRATPVSADSNSSRAFRDRSAAAADWIFVSAELAGTSDDAAVIGRRMADIQAAREASQPIRARTGGSTFANPPGHKAWELIDRAGCRGLTRGGAQVSEKHANFLINTGAATAADLEGLGEEVRRRVFESTGVTLEWEIKRVGSALPAWGGVA